MNTRNPFSPKVLNVGDTVVCAEIKESFTVARWRDISFNYAIDANGEILSLPGALIRVRRAIKQHSERIYLYVSSDGKHIATWTGDIVGTIVAHTTVKLTRWSAFHGRTMQAYTVKDEWGRLWYGRGSPGVAIMLRPKKG